MSLITRHPQTLSSAALRVVVVLASFDFVFGQTSLLPLTEATPEKRSGGRTRIVFDYDQRPPAEATPAPSPTASPEPSATVTPDHGLENPPTIASTPAPPDFPNLVPVTPAPIAEATPEPVAEATPEPVAEATPEPIAEATPEPVAEATPEPVAEATPEPIAEATPEPVAEATPEPVAEATPEPVAEATPEPIAEATPEPIAEATPEPIAEVTPSGKSSFFSSDPLSASEPSPTQLATALSDSALADARPIESPTPAPTPEIESPAGQTTDLSPSLPVASAPDRERPPSESVTINLIKKLVQRGLLSEEDAKEMLAQAEAEAETAKAQSQADMFAIAQVAVAQAAEDQRVMDAQSGGPVESPDDVRVTFVPDIVKTQIKEDIKTELRKEARANGGNISPIELLPDWVARIHPFFDIRFRYESILYPEGNDITGAFPNFNAINTGAPFDVAGNVFSPQFNADQNRNRFRFRVRLGAELDLTESFTAGLRITTGDTNSPVTANQTFGLANQGQGGQFSKYAIWLDRAFVRYELGDKNRGLSVLVGRFDNPFFSTPAIWDDELGFDGIALQAKYEVVKGVTPFLTGGAFPVYNTDLNFSSNQPAKFESYDKYLFGGQLGVNWKINDDWNAKFAVAYYYFYNIEGKLSSPYTPQNASDAGDTDGSRPSFAQKGNTYMALRNIVPDASNDFGTINQYQYFGLATKFENLTLTGRIDYNGWEPYQISLIGEYIQNLAYNKGSINEIAVNNRGPLDDDDLSDTIGNYEGSPVAWLIELRFGKPALEKALDWNVGVGYRYLGSDSVVDGFNDSDFGLGGTNMQGFTVGGQLALSSHTWISLRWYGADSLAGPQYKVNVFQLDFSAKF